MFWQRVIIDVAEDPTPYLETITFNDHRYEPRLDLIVLSSSSGITKGVENVRAHCVFKPLDKGRQGLARYSRIAFHLVYQSSLPNVLDILYRGSALDEHQLRCTMHDRDS